MNNSGIRAQTIRLCWAMKPDGSNILLHNQFGTYDANTDMFTTDDGKYTFPVTQNDWNPIG